MTILEKANAILAEKEAKVLPENIKSGVTIFGVEGTVSGIDIPEFTPDTDDVSIGYVTSSVANSDDDTQTIGIKSEVLKDFVVREGSFIRTQISYADVANMIGLTADKIKAGETILGITGTYTGE